MNTALDYKMLLMQCKTWCVRNLICYVWSQ